MTRSEKQAVMILAGCPTGATLDALKARGVAAETIEDLLSRGLIWRQDQKKANPPGLVVRRYFLTVRDVDATFKSLVRE